MSDISFLIIAGIAVLVGAAVQSSIGLGLGLIAAPLVSYLEPTLMPGAMLITTAVLPLLIAISEWRHIDWYGLAWGLPGRLPGSLVGAGVVAVLEPRMLGGAVGAVVLIAVGLSLLSVRVRITPVSLLTAGAVSGVMSTATSIGGPPVALLYQREPGPKVRGTLNAFFLFGVVLSLSALALTGQLDRAEVYWGLALVPFVVAGFLAGRPLRARVDAGRLRIALLCVVTLSALVLMVRSLM